MGLPVLTLKKAAICVKAYQSCPGQGVEDSIKSIRPYTVPLLVLAGCKNIEVVLVLWHRRLTRRWDCLYSPLNRLP